MAPLSYDQLIIDTADYIHSDIAISEKTWTNARNALLDSLSCAIETLHQSTECSAIIGPIVPGTIVPNGFRLPGTTHQLDPMKGSFDLASLIRYLDHNDAYPGKEWGHPSDSIGALLAVADSRSRNHPETPIPIKTLLTAIVKSYEIQGIYQERNPFNEHGLDHTLLVKLASTASLSLLLNLSHSQTCASISQVWTDSSPLRLFRQSPNTGPRKGWAAGDACMRAVHLALLTEKGQSGYPTALSDPGWGFLKHQYGGNPLLTRPFSTTVIDNRFVKIIAAEGHAISAIEAALTLSKTLTSMNITNPAEAISKIKIRTMAAAMSITDKSGELRNAADRDHCMRYMVSLTLLKHDWPAASDYKDNSPFATNPDLEILRSVIEMEEDSQLTADYHSRSKRTGASGLTIFLKDGRVLEECLVEYPVGHPWHESTEKALKEKIIQNLGQGFDSKTVDRIMNTAGAGDFLDQSVDAFVDLFWKGDVGDARDEGANAAHNEEVSVKGGPWKLCIVM